MSQLTQFHDGTLVGMIMTLTDDFGTAVGPDAVGNITIEGDSYITVTGTVLTNNMQITISNSVAASFVTDVGTATPAINILNVLGGTNINTAGAANNVTVNLDATITLTQVNATTFDTNVAAAGVTLAGTSLIADGTDANININITSKGTGQVIIDDLQLLTPLTVPYGGTGLATITDHGLMVGSGAGNVTPLAVGTNGQVALGSTAADPVFATLGSTLGTVQYTTGAGTLALDVEVAQALTGFASWDGGSPFFDDTVLGDFEVSQSGSGYIRGKEITWTAPQTETGLTAGNTYFIYIDNTGTIGKTTTYSSALFRDNIVLFEVLRDSTAGVNNQITVKENHPYQVPWETSVYLHDVVGAVIANNQGGANIVLNGTQKIEISGADELEDHGLETDIPDSSGVGVTFNQYFTLGSGKWALNSTTDTFIGEYNNAGAATALGAGKFAIYTLYVSKDNLNVTTPVYLAVLDDAQYNNLTAANTAIALGTPAKATTELAALEVAQLGFIVYSEATSTIVNVVIEKETLRETVSTSGTNLASLVLTDVTNFDGILSAADTTVQSALETIDDWGGGATDHAVMLGSGVNTPLSATTVGTNGQVVVGSTGADPDFATIGSTDGSITVTGGAGTLVLEGTAAGTAQVGSVELTTDAEAIAGTDTTRAVTAEALKAKLGTQTDHGVLVGSATTAAITALTVGTNGQVLVGSTAADPVFATITDGTGITTTLGAGTLAIKSTGTTLNNQTGTTYTLVLTDEGKFITFTNAAAIAVTVPTNAAVAFPIGTTIGFCQGGAGQVTFAGAGPPTLNSASSALTTVEQYSMGYMIKTATDVWYVGGDLEA